MIELVETTLDFDTRDHQITIKSEFDTTLQEIAKKLSKIKDSLNKQFEETAEDLGFDTSNPRKCPLNFENHQVYGHCFRLTRKVCFCFLPTFHVKKWLVPVPDGIRADSAILILQEATIIKGKKGYIELANRQNGCFFTTKDLKRLNESFVDLQATYERKQSTLAKEVISIAGEHVLQMAFLSQALKYSTTRLVCPKSRRNQRSNCPSGCHYQVSEGVDQPFPPMC